MSLHFHSEYLHEIETNIGDTKYFVKWMMDTSRNHEKQG